MTNPTLRDLYGMYINQVAENVRLTWGYQIISTLLHQGRLFKERSIRRHTVSKRDIGQILHTRWDLIGALQKNGQGFSGMENNVYQTCLSRSVEIDTVITTAGTAHFLNALRHFTHSEHGSDVYPEKRRKHLDTEGHSVTRLHGLRIIESRIYNSCDGGGMDDPLVERVYISQYYSMFPSVPEVECTDDYRSRMRHIGIVDATTFQTKEITLLDAFNNCGLFHEERADESIHYDHLMESLLDTTDQAKWTAATLFQKAGIYDHITAHLETTKPKLDALRKLTGGTVSASTPAITCTCPAGVSTTVCLDSLGDHVDKLDDMYKQYPFMKGGMGSDVLPRGVTHDAIVFHCDALALAKYHPVTASLLLETIKSNFAEFTQPYHVLTLPCKDIHKDFFLADLKQDYFTASCGSTRTQVRCIRTVDVTVPFELKYINGRKAHEKLNAYYINTVFFKLATAIKDANTTDPNLNTSWTKLDEINNHYHHSLLKYVFTHWSDPNPESDDLKQMADVVEDGLQEGAFFKPPSVDTFPMINNFSTQTVDYSTLEILRHMLWQMYILDKLGKNKTNAFAEPTANFWKSRYAFLNDRVELIYEQIRAKNCTCATSASTVEVEVGDVLQNIQLSDYRFWKMLITHNIPFPVGFLIFRMHFLIEVGSALFFKKGEHTGVLVLKDCGVTFNRKTDDFSMEVGVRMSSNIIVHRPENIEVLQHVFVKQYIEGGGVSFYNAANSEHVCSYKEDATHDHQLFSVVVPYDHVSDNSFIDISGAMHPAIANVSGASFYKTAGVYSNIWNWQANRYAIHPDRLHGQLSNSLSVCAQSSQYNYNPMTKRCDLLQSGVCPMGPQANPQNWRVILQGEVGAYGGSGFEGSRPAAAA